MEKNLDFQDMESYHGYQVQRGKLFFNPHAHGVSQAPSTPIFDIQADTKSLRYGKEMRDQCSYYFLQVFYPKWKRDGYRPEK